MSAVKTPVGLGIVGCGNILAAYMTGFSKSPSRVRIVRFADVDVSRAEAASSEYGVGRGGTVGTGCRGPRGVRGEAPVEDRLAAAVATALNVGLSASACRANAELCSSSMFSTRLVDWVVASAEARGIKIDDPRTHETV